MLRPLDEPLAMLAAAKGCIHDDIETTGQEVFRIPEKLHVDLGGRRGCVYPLTHSRFRAWGLGKAGMALALHIRAQVNGPQARRQLSGEPGLSRSGRAARQ